MVTQSRDIYNALIWNLQSVIGSSKKKQASKHTHACSQCTHGSVGAHARPNKVLVFTVNYLLVASRQGFFIHSVMLLATA